MISVEGTVGRYREMLSELSIQGRRYLNRCTFKSESCRVRNCYKLLTINQVHPPFLKYGVANQLDPAPRP